MPIDEFGIRAEILVYERSTTARLNPGQLYEQFSAAFLRDVRLDIIDMMNKGDFASAWNHIETAYRIAYPEMIELLSLDTISMTDKKAHINTIIEDMIRVKISPTAPYVGKQWFKNIMTFRPPNMSPVSYVDLAGQPQVTKIPMLMGKIRYMVLEKCDYKAFAASTTQLQSHGLAGTGSKNSKHKSLVTRKAPRVFSESETRAHSNVLGGRVVAALMEMSTNPDATEAAVRTLMTSPKPLMEETLVDRTKVPFGESRSLALIDQSLLCQGVILSR